MWLVDIRKEMAARKLQLFPAGAPELVRSNQKDVYYSGYLTTLLSDLTEPILPRCYWLHWQREMQLMAELLYYSLTTLKGNQTLGEEYCNMIQVTNERQIPLLKRRIFSIVLHVIGRYGLEKCLGLIKHRLARTNNDNLPNSVELLEEVVGTANQLHLALFYLYGVYQWLGKRFTGIKYLMVQYDNWSPVANPYKLLGLLILLQLAIRLGKWLKDWLMPAANNSEVSKWRNESLRHQKSKPDVDEIDETLKCSLCFEGCVSPTVPPCGHLYCWNCIMEWITDKNQCPVCRRVVQPRELVPLQNFKLQ